MWARRLTSLPLRPIRVRILRGPNAGRWWSLPVSGRGVLWGRYEPIRFATLAALVRPGETFWDVGAHYGYASLIAASRLGDSGRLVAIEPSSANRQYLERHLRWNRVEASGVLPCAVAEEDGCDVFGGRGGSVSFHLGHPGERIPVRSIDSLADGNAPAPTLLKIDVEGAEARALTGASAVLSGSLGNRAPTVLVSVHEPRLLAECRDVLARFDYSILASPGVVDFMDGRTKWSGDPDLLAVPPHRVRDISALAAIPGFREGRAI